MALSLNNRAAEVEEAIGVTEVLVVDVDKKMI